VGPKGTRRANRRHIALAAAQHDVTPKRTEPDPDLLPPLGVRERIEVLVRNEVAVVQTFRLKALPKSPPTPGQLLTNMTAIIILAIAIWVVALLLNWKRPFLIGKRGENFVSRKLLELDSKHYKVLGDLMLPSLGNTNTTQIDHIVVSDFGIFCIETKSDSGWIFGNARQQHWTQVLYRYKKKFYNPLRQNYAHIKAVEAIVSPKYQKVPIRGFIAFPCAEKLKISGTDAVGHVEDVLVKIKALSAPVLSPADRLAIVGLLLNANIRDKQARKLHNKSVRGLKVSNGF
jgi:hypothetical protein